MNTELKQHLFKRPNSDKMLAAAAPTVGGLKGVIAGFLIINDYVRITYLLIIILKSQEA